MKVFLLIIYFLIVAISISYAQTLEKIAEETANINVFLENRTNKKELFQGESFINDYYLIINKDIILKNIQLLSFSSFNTLKSKEIDIGNLFYTDTLIDNVLFQKALLHRYILTPTKSTDYMLEPIKFEVNIDIPIDNNYLSQYKNEAPNGYYSFKHTVQSNVTNIKINELPKNSNNELPVFIGDFEIDYSINKVTAKKNERIQMIVTITGEGDLTVPFVPTLTKTDGLKSNVYKAFDSINVVRNEIVSKKVFEIDLFATEVKEYTIKPIEILCFSPTLKEYYYLKTSSIPVFYIDNNKLQNNNNNNSYILFIIIFIIIGLAIFVVLLFRYSKRISKVLRKSKNKDNSFENNEIITMPFYSDIAKQHLSIAYRLINENIDDFLRELAVGINEFISQHFQINCITTNKEQIVEQLIHNNVSPEIANSYLLINQKIDAIRFSKDKLNLTQQEKEQIFIEVERFINDLERHIE